MGSVSSLPNNLLQSILSSSLQGTSLTGSAGAGSTAGVTGTSSDSSQISPLAKLLSQLQQLQQSDPAEYKAVTKQIATALKSAAQSDTASGNSAGAAQLNQLATDFTQASTNGQLPNVQDLAKAIGGGGHHHHHAAAASSSDSDSTSSSSTSSTSSSQSSSQSDSTDPLSVILNALSSAGSDSAD